MVGNDMRGPKQCCLNFALAGRPDVMEARLAFFTFRYLHLSKDVIFAFSFRAKRSRPGGPGRSRCSNNGIARRPPPTVRAGLISPRLSRPRSGPNVGAQSLAHALAFHPQLGGGSNLHTVRSTRQSYADMLGLPSTS